MLRLKNIKIINFGALKNVNLDFEDKDIVGILAEYHNDKMRSNASGKTLVLEAVRYNLVGLCRYKKEIKMIHYGEDMMKVICEYIDDDGKVYKITRGRDSANTGILELDWIEKTAESQQAITDIFGITKYDFDTTSFFKQADINGFMDLDPAKKTAYLQSVMDNDHWKTREERVKEDIRKLNTEMKENNAVKNALEASLEIDEHLKIKVKELEDSNVVHKAHMTKVNNSLGTLIAKSESIRRDNLTLHNKISTLTSRLNELRNQSSEKIRLNKVITRGKLSVLNLRKEIAGIKPKGTLETIAEAKALAEQEIRKIVGLLKLEDIGICPLLNESCDRIPSNEADKNKLSKRKELLKRNLTSLEVDKLKISNIDSLSNTLRTIKNDTEKNIIKYKNIEGCDVESVSELIQDTRDLLEEEIDPQDITDLKNTVESRRSGISENNSKIAVLNHRIKTAEEALARIDGIYDKNEKLVILLEKLKYVLMMFGKSGILADEIENAFTDIQDDINYILKELDIGLTVSFSPDKELDKKESVCNCGFVYYKNYKKPVCEECGMIRRKARKDEISLTILDSNGNEADFEGNSGGQKSSISYAVRIALTMFKRRQNKCQLNMLFLDEVDSALDPYLANSITNSITKVLTKKLGYAQILMVSHKEEIKNAVPNIIKVVKMETYSTAEFV
jgi:DNA repair exonuclease SbcCD ATPase subunit